LPCSHIVPSATASAICISFNANYTVYTLFVSRTLARPSRSLSMTRPCVQWRLCRLSLEDIHRTSPRATGRTEDLDYQFNSPGIESRRRSELTPRSITARRGTAQPLIAIVSPVRRFSPAHFPAACPRFPILEMLFPFWSVSLPQAIQAEPAFYRNMPE
jgi:hypothetical protein